MEVQFRVKFIRKYIPIALWRHIICVIYYAYFSFPVKTGRNISRKNVLTNKTVLSRSELFIHRMKSERFKPASVNKSMNNWSAMLLNSKLGYQKINERNSLVLVWQYLFTGNEITRITKYYAALRNRFTRCFFKISIQLM